jgi:SAM-dependent methyltransferase
MQIDWQKIAYYLAVPGTNNTLSHSDGSFQAENSALKFPVHGHIVDFTGGASTKKAGSTSQLDYWESSKPGLRLPNHPVQVQFAEQRFQYLSRFIPFQDVQSGLDVGCGNGVGTISLNRRVDVVFGLDMSKYLLNQMPDNIVGIRGDASRLPLRDKAVDMSMAWELIHHIEDPVAVFLEMRRVTRRWIVVFEPNRWNPLQAGFSLAVSKERLGLRNTRSYLMNIMAKARLNVVHYATVGYIFPNKSPIWLASVLGKVPFEIPYLGISHLLIAEIQ